MKILFLGTPEPAAKCLEALINAKEEIIGVITQPDKPKGRGLVLTEPAVKTVAKKYNIPIYQPEKIKDTSQIELVKKLSPDLIVVVAYGRILPEEIINAPKFGSINVHTSLLPKYRGAAPIQRAILNGDAETGVTIQKVFYDLDSGDIILQEKVTIDEKDNISTLTDKLFNVGVPLLLKAVSQIKSGTAKHIKQDPKEVTIASILKKEDGLIDWKKDAKSIFNQIRGCDPWPGAYTYYKDKILKIWKAEVQGKGVSFEPGKIYEIEKNKGFLIGTGNGALLIEEVQLEASKKMSAYQFVIGHGLKDGDILES